MAHEYSWEEEVLIIDLYTRTATSKIQNSNPEIIELNNYLRSNGYDCVLSGIRNKMENLKSIDEDYIADGRVGRAHIAKSLKELWKQYSSAGFATLDRDVERANELVMNHISKKEPMMHREHRDGQYIFRTRILAAYDNACCISKMKEPSLLQACHIKPHSVCIKEGHPEQAVDVRNGLCMNALYHKAFDSGLISIDEDMCLMISPKIMIDGEDRFFRPFEGKKIYQSSRAVAGESYLKYHRENIFCENF